MNFRRYIKAIAAQAGGAIATLIAYGITLAVKQPIPDEIMSSLVLVIGVVISTASTASVYIAPRNAE